MLSSWKAVSLAWLIGNASAHPRGQSKDNGWADKQNYTNGASTCRRTQVAILGAGVAGLTAAQALANQSISDFVIIEYNSEVGGRVKHTDFNGITVELGANWVQGLGTPGGPENPIWTLAKKYNITNTYSNYSSILTYNETGYTDFSDLLDTFEEAYTTLQEDAGYILVDNLQDRSVRSGLRLSDWKPRTMDRVMAAEAVEWWEWDWEYAAKPEESSQLFGITNYNTSFYQWSEENNYVYDSRGFSFIFSAEASTFLTQNDSRLLLSTTVTNISYTDDGVTVYNEDGSCVQADYAICTFSVGVLQHDVVAFDPPLPDWKDTAISSFTMGTYTKIFLQFNETFWDPNTQFLLYASPTTRGSYPVWQSLSGPGFLPGSNIIFVTVVDTESYRVERQSDEQTKNEVLAVLRQMFPDVDVPEPIAFMYPRWSNEPWAYGSYSNWPPATTLEMHQNLRANIGRLWFAGEATSPSYYGFLQGAWYEGREAGNKIAGMLKVAKSGAEGDAACLSTTYVNTGTGNVTANGVDCGNEEHYEVLHGTTPVSEFASVNGWDVSSFLTYGYTE